MILFVFLPLTLTLEPAVQSLHDLPWETPVSGILPRFLSICFFASRFSLRLPGSTLLSVSGLVAPLSLDSRHRSYSVFLAPFFFSTLCVAVALLDRACNSLPDSSFAELLVSE